MAWLCVHNNYSVLQMHNVRPTAMKVNLPSSLCDTKVASFSCNITSHLSAVATEWHQSKSSACPTTPSNHVNYQLRHQEVQARVISPSFLETANGSYMILGVCVKDTVMSLSKTQVQWGICMKHYMECWSCLLGECCGTICTMSMPGY